MEGAKDLVDTFEIKNSDLSDYNLLKEFKNLKDITLNKLNLNDSSAKKYFRCYQCFDKLSIRNNQITSLRTIIDTQPNLTSLDVSGIDSKFIRN